MAGTQQGNCMKGPEATGLVRPRLMPDLGGASNVRLGLVIAPPGTGKTTLLAQWAAQRSTAVAWYRSSQGEAKPGRMLGCFAAGLAMAVGDEFPRPFPDLELLAGRLEKPFVFVVDDLHALAHTCAESELERLLALNSRRAPAGGAARSAPSPWRTPPPRPPRCAGSRPPFPAE